MSLLKLPREIRDQIYRDVLCSPRGVWVICDSISNDQSRFKEEGEGESDGSLSRLLLFVNRQIFAECYGVFYKFNQFTLDVSPKLGIRFLQILHPTMRLFITDLGFTSKSTPYDKLSTSGDWDPIFALIGQEMRVSSVTIQVPDYAEHVIDETKPSEPHLNVQTYDWVPVIGLRILLLDGKIQKLRLGYHATYLRPRSSGSRTIGSDGFEDFFVVNVLRCPWPRLDRDYTFEELDTSEFLQLEELSQRLRSLDAPRFFQRRKLNRVKFVVTREDNLASDIGIVLVLTRPPLADNKT